MESFSLAAEHAGAIQHTHLIRLDASAVAAARELRIAITVIVAGRHVLILNPSQGANSIKVSNLIKETSLPSSFFFARDDVNSKFILHLTSKTSECNTIVLAGAFHSILDPALSVMAHNKGSPQHRPRFNYPSPTDAGGIHPERPTYQTSQSPLPQLPNTARHQKQRRISRSQHGLRVSRRLPPRTSRGSLPPTDDPSPSSPQSPYWGTLPSPSKSSRDARPDDRAVDIPSNGPVNTDSSNDKVRPGTERLHHCPELTDPRRRGRKTPNREKRFGVADPLAWDVINRSLTQQRRLSSIVSTEGPVTVPVKQSSNKTADVASRTSSQRMALNRFARELAKYADAAGATGKAPVITPTISESKASIHTVKPLVPYKDEFLAAGLAVTSAEQNRNLTSKIHAQASLRRNKRHKHSNGPLQARKKSDTPGDGASSRASPSMTCTSSGSYVEFSPPGGHMFHAIESLVPRKANTKPKHCHHARRHLLSWFIKKPTSKDSNMNGQQNPVRTQERKGGQIKSNNVSAQHERRRLQHRTHRRNMQSIPEIQLWPKPAPPAKYVTPKKEPCVAVASDYYEQIGEGFHPAQEDRHYRSALDAKQSLDQFGLRGQRDLTRGVLPKPLPEPIATIEEETEINSLMDSNQDHPLPPMKHKEMPSVAENTHRRPNAASSVTHKSSIPSLPFAARLAASTASSLQRALDDACQKIEGKGQHAYNSLEQEDTKEELPPIPQRDLRHNASHPPHPRKPCSTEKFIYVKRNMPTVQPLQSTSKPLPPEPVEATQVTLEKRPGTKLPQPSRKARPPVPPAPRPLTGKRKNAVAELAKAEEMLKDLDVFLNDYDDADIEDRDVIKGLQVAIHAAADDLYDGYIRHKTGLRIRRFLADLKSFEDVTELGPKDQRAREKRAESRRIEGIRGQNNRR
ncbi:hypothetical protein F5Y09DRAFT_341855 [Xylaria sp. FL1042]|nr:hypothetical protein F5Y09DRAFT_341855 [Xylaria sp. FL1042]